MGGRTWKYWASSGPVFSVVFLLLLCFIAHLYEANGGTDMEVLACFRPCFSSCYGHLDNRKIGLVRFKSVAQLTFCPTKMSGLNKPFHKIRLDSTHSSGFRAPESFDKSGTSSGGDTQNQFAEEMQARLTTSFPSTTDFSSIRCGSQGEKKPSLKRANNSMSVPPLASFKWSIKHKRNRKTKEKQARSNPYCPILSPTLGTIASGNFL